MLGTCMQGRGRQDEDVDDEAVHDNVGLLYTERGSVCAYRWGSCEVASPRLP